MGGSFLQSVRNVVRAKGSRADRGDGGESGSETTSEADARPGPKDRSSKHFKWTAAGAFLVVLLWTGGSVAFAYLYNYLPFETFKSPESIPRLPSACQVSQLAKGPINCADVCESDGVGEAFWTHFLSVAHHRCLPCGQRLPAERRH